MQRVRPQVSARPPRGFTLPEVLVALAITSMMVTLLVGILYYVFRVQVTMRDEVLAREAGLRARAWFEEVVRGCLPAPRDSASAFTGSAHTLRCETLSPLRPQQVPMPLPVVLSLVDEPEHIRLEYREDLAGAPVPAAGLHAWPAGEVRNLRFVYVDARGEEVDSWPGDHPVTEVLPTRVLIRYEQRTGRQSMEVVWPALPAAGPWGEPPPQNNPFGIEVPR